MKKLLIKGFVLFFSIIVLSLSALFAYEHISQSEHFRNSVTQAAETALPYSHSD